jgi:hypothetical protein
METNSLAVFRVIFGLLFLGVLAAGGYLFKNYQRLFGPDPSIPSENSSARGFTKLQAFVLWAHAAALTGAFALLLH